ncbi:izumo sperm-egg fusion protein 4 isoform X4 [Nannospalax galili]|uniref:izumo sperm-egg fusion protein 4 isoform X4 n=1 Tax=Nannospalax galili TaxID=1026970 RepID=UPI00111C2DA5|nr:izumo sperm-egg fusion protein 4 isoform X4 [Nannospalax galili]
MGSRGRRGGALGLLLYLGLTAELAGGCLHCDPNFSEKFCYYRHHVNLKSWWVGDIPVSGMLLTEWSQNTMKELHLAIPAEITREKLDQVAGAVYQRMDQLYQGKIYFPGYFPNELRAIFREQVRLIQNAIIESRIDCQHHCGIFQYGTISCTNCTDSHVVCFGYHCKYNLAALLSLESSVHHPGRGGDLKLGKTPSPSTVSPQVISTVGDSCTGPPELHKCLAPTGHTDEKHPSLHLINLTLEHASECLTQH